jgi:hypothetical protein
MVPEGMKELLLANSRLQASPGCPRGEKYDFNYKSYDYYDHKDYVAELRGWTQGGAAVEDGKEGKAGVDDGEEGATEIEALRAFAESVGYKNDIMDGVVTQCAGGAIVAIEWKSKNLDGTLPVGGLNMPKLRVLNLSQNKNLKGERERVRRDKSLNK